MADFSATPLNGNVPLEVQFTSLTVGDSYQWNFGDGFLSEEENPSHEYFCPGIYTVSLTVTSGAVDDIEIKYEYIQILHYLPVLPENECCFGPYNITCIGCSSGSDTDWIDSEKTLLICKNADCSKSCIAEYGSIYDIIDDFTDDCPSCRECYLEDKSKLGRYYTLVITNCEVIISNYLVQSNCGTCLEKSETFCFSMKGCGDTDPNNPSCYSVFEFDDQIFMVTGEPGQCSSEIDCESCWKQGNLTIGEQLSFLPETNLDSCDTLTESISAETQTQTESAVEIQWHNTPSAEGFGTHCTTEVLLPENEEERNLPVRSFQNPDVAITPSGHAIVAYEDRSDIGQTKIYFSEQPTTVINRVVNYRSLGKGRLINSSLDGGIIKLRIYDDFFTDIVLDNHCTADLSSSSYSIGFKNGPLAGTMYSIKNVKREPCNGDIVYGSSGKNVFNFYYDRTYNKLYVITLGSESVTQIIKLDPVSDSSSVSIDTISLSYITAIFVDSYNEIYYCLRNTSAAGSAYEIYRRGFSSTIWTLVLSFTSSTNSYNTALDVDIDTGKVYYVKEGEIRTVNNDGTGDTSLIITDETDVLSVKIDKTYSKLYWTEYNNGKIKKSNLNGTDIETVISNTEYKPSGLDVQENRIYWADANHLSIKSAKKDGSDIFANLSLLNIDRIPTRIFVNENSSKIYFTDGVSADISGFTFYTISGELKKTEITNRLFYELEIEI